MGSFSPTYGGTAYTVYERAINIVFNDDNSLRLLSVVAARPTIGGEEQRTANVDQARGVAILQAAGYTTQQISDMRTMLRKVIEEGILDAYDDARQA